MHCVLVSHTHWDREWYKTFQSFRARLVDTIDCVLELVASDPDFRFQLDGQSIVLEDYLEVRPERAGEIDAAIAAGRVAVGPWYVQPDSLIPTGETHVRNLLEGRRVALAHGACSRIAYTPDSFGHPAQFPQMFAGFGLGPFIYWRGNDDEIADLPSEWRWRSPDGSTIGACHLARGYFPAWGLSEDTEATSTRLEKLGQELAAASGGEVVLMMNGLDHMLPDANTREATEALAKRTGWTVERGLLDDYVAALGDQLEAAPAFEGELVGGHLANLLPGVWSTHVDLKLLNRHCEHALQHELEPAVVLGRALAVTDERATLRSAWRALLPNQAHDSICGCSQDRVHTQMTSRLEEVDEWADETTTRVLERLSGLAVDRQLPATDEAGGDIAVWNLSPRTRTDRVRLALGGFPAYSKNGVHPLLQLNLGLEGVSVGGQAARVTPYTGTQRPGLAPGIAAHDVEFVAEDVPAFGWRRFSVQAAKPAPEDVEDAGVEIAQGGLHVQASEHGFDVRIGEQTFLGLCGVEDQGDRGDTYDFDPVGPTEARVETHRILRRRDASGIQSLRLDRTLSVPASLDAEREGRTTDRVTLALNITATLAPGVDHVDLAVTLDNTAQDHRLRLLFPVGAPTPRFDAATTFGRATRDAGARVRPDWIHPPPTTVAQQGWVHAGGLTVGAPGLLEAEVSPEGVIAVTLIRSVGWLSRPDLTTRPGEAGPSLPTPGAQCLGPQTSRLTLHGGFAPEAAEAAEHRLIVVGAGPAPVTPEGEALLSVAGQDISLSACKPAESGPGAILRLLNSGDTPQTARVALAPILAARVTWAALTELDEVAQGAAIPLVEGHFEVDVPAHALRSVRLEFEALETEPQ